MSKILVIDDEPANVRVLSISLRSDGHEVVTAGNGEQGLAVFERERPDIVLTDIKMPGMDGIEVLEKIKAMNADAEVIMVTGHGDIDNAIEALKHGASDFLNKPVRDAAISIALKRAQEKLDIRRKLAAYTENLESEIERATARLRRSERLAAIGQTVAGVAHSIKNILHGFKGGSYLMDLGLSRNDRQKLEAGWDMVRRNITLTSDLVLDMLSYSKDREPEYEPCQPNAVATEVCEMLRQTAHENQVAIVTDLDPQIDQVIMDPRTIERVLMNLMTNAIDACMFDASSKKSWQVCLKTRCEPGHWIRFAVTDNGVGMTDAVREKLFTSFFSTKGHRGTGLGLLVTQKLIEEHDGQISVDSRDGVGSTLTVRLPFQVVDSSTPCDNEPDRRDDNVRHGM